jgi:D-aminopeptidase
VRAGGCDFTLGCLALTNFGSASDLTIGGMAVGRSLARGLEDQRCGAEERGSVIVILATDIPLSDRQLKRLCRRASVGLARTGAFIGNGSGEIAVAFSTANRVPHYGGNAFLSLRQLRDDLLDPLFRAVASATEEAVLSSLFHAKTTADRNGEPRLCLADAITRLYRETRDEELSKLINFFADPADPRAL